jgi:hypothetical protein
LRDKTLMNRFIDWSLDVVKDVLVGLAIYGLLRLIEGRRGMEWTEVFRFLRDRSTQRFVPAGPPRWPT